MQYRLYNYSKFIIVCSAGIGLWIVYDNPPDHYHLSVTENTRYIISCILRLVNWKWVRKYETLITLELKHSDVEFRSVAYVFFVNVSWRENPAGTRKYTTRFIVFFFLNAWRRTHFCVFVCHDVLPKLIMEADYKTIKLINNLACHWSHASHSHSYYFVKKYPHVVLLNY